MAVASPSEAEHSTPARILRELGIDPKKSLGQHFLHDRRIVQRIVDLADVAETDLIIEVGPGLGIMTQELARRAHRVIAVEKDSLLVLGLRARMPANVEIVEADAIEVDYANLSKGRPYKFVANLPYNVANRIVRTVLESGQPPESLTIMVQREVAERMTAHPPDMSLLSLAVQFYGDPRIGFRVGRGAFMPPPTVDSTVVRIDTRDPLLPKSEWAEFFGLARHAFQHRRKQLAGTIANALDFPRDRVRDVLKDIGASPDARPEQLDLNQWIMLYRALKNDR